MKSSHQQGLEVTPRKKYREPRYPIAENFDLAALQDQPYPFSSRFRSWVTTVGASSLICSLVTGDAPAADDRGHPFTVANSGLPFRTSPYGTGQPSYLSQEQAREIIDKIFAENGFKLRKNFAYRKDDIAFQATGFDADARVGYVWGDWNSLDPADAIINWIDAQFSKERIEQTIEMSKGDSDSLERTADHLVKVLDRKDKEKQFESQITQVKSIDDLRERLRAMAEIFEKIKSKENDDQVSLREMKALEASDEEDRDFVAVISQYQFPFNGYAVTPETQEKWKAARLIEDNQERAEAFKRIHEEAAGETLKRLEDSVRDYLDWARGQGLQN